jgi:3-dehydroquinate synthase
MSTLTVGSRLGDYTVSFESDLDFLKPLASGGNRVLVVDRNVHRLYEAQLKEALDSAPVLLIDAIEENKNLEQVTGLYRNLMERHAKKNLTIVSIGGGITQDVTGFAASTLYRGVGWIFVPTTLLAQADSCIGSKTSLNFLSYQNLIGTFYPPARVFIHPGFLKTLARADFFSGLGEAIKLLLMREDRPLDTAAIAERIAGAIADEARMLELIRECLQVKISYMQDDEFDRGRRNLLNYGHCFGHALETASRYYVPHGIAVVIGILFANRLAERRGLLGGGIAERVAEGLLLPHIPIPLRRVDFALERLLDGMRSDKKRVGAGLTMIVPDAGFKLIKIEDVSEGEVACTLEDIVARLQPV